MVSKKHFFGLFAIAALSLSLTASIFIAAKLSDDADASVYQAAEGTYWSTVDTSGNTYGSAFRANLKSIMVSKGTATGSNSYKALNTILKSTDAHPTSSGAICAFYRQDSASTSWNKEHVWPNSRGAGENAGYAGTDPQVIRPTNTSDNSSRSNYMYGETTSPSQSNGWDPNSFGYDAARGEAARIIFYAATRYSNMSLSGAGGSYDGSANGLELTENLNDDTNNATMGKLSTLLKWNLQYPVTRAETYRNEYCTTNSYARNPFIDHPEWANYIWDVNAGSSNKYLRQSAYTPTVTSSSSVSSTSTYSSSSSSSSTTSTPSSTSSNSSSSSTQSISGDGVTITGGSTNMPTTYPATVSYSLEGLDLTLLNVATFDSGSTMQFKKSGSYMSNASAFSKSISSIVVTVSSGAAPTVSYGSTSSLGSTSTSSSSGSVYTYTLGSGATFFKLANDSSAVAKYTSIQINFAASASVAVTGVSLSSSTASVKVGATTSLTATVSPSDATNKNVTWSSSDTSVASVSGGVVTGVKAGSATITVTTADGGLQDTCSVSVSNVEATAVTMSASSASLIVGGTQQLSVTFTPSNTTDQSGIWDSSNTTVATVSDTGLVTAKAAGSTTVSFLSNSGSLRADCTVTVSETVVLSSISVSGASASATFGSTYSTSGIVVTAHYSDGSTKDVTSSSSVSSPNTKLIGTQTPTVSYTEDSLTKTATYSVFVTTVGATQGSGTGGYSLITSLSDLTIGSQVVIGATLSLTTYVMTTDQQSSYRGNEAATLSGSTLTLGSSSAAAVLTVGQGSTDSSAYTLYDSSTSSKGYIYASAAKSLKTETTLTATGEWSITITSAGVATITNTTSSYGSIQYNAGSPRFTTYTSSQTSVSLYKANASQLFTDQEEAEAWSNYFVSCTSNNCSSSTIWSDANTQYTNMSTTAKAYFVAHESDNATISAAYSRYNYAVNAHGMTDFIGASGNGAADVSSSNSGTYVALAAILGVFALTTLGYVGFSYRRKHN